MKLANDDASGFNPLFGRLVALVQMHCRCDPSQLLVTLSLCCLLNPHLALLRHHFAHLGNDQTVLDPLWQGKKDRQHGCVRSIAPSAASPYQQPAKTSARTTRHSHYFATASRFRQSALRELSRTWLQPGLRPLRPPGRDVRRGDVLDFDIPALGHEFHLQGPRSGLVEGFARGVQGQPRGWHVCRRTPDFLD